MKATDFLDFQKITKNALKEFPASWQKLSKTYFHNFTRKEIIQLNTLAILVGLGAGFGAILFRYLIGTFQNFIMHNQWDYHLISPVEHVRGAWIFLILPIGLLLSTLITHFFAKEATGHGVPEVLEAVWTKAGKMRKRVVAVKALASSITISCGGSVGREGPIVQIGTAFGSSIGQLLNLNPKIMKTLVGCGAAGAIAATFNTPIAGVIFAIEVIVLELKTRSFVPLVISSVFATVVSRVYLGNEPAFFVPEYILKSPQELIFYLILGILSGIVGVIVIKVLYGTEDLVNGLNIPFWMKPLGAGLIVASIGYFYPQAFGVGYETISDVLQQKASFPLMFSLIGIKILSMSITLAGGGSGGVFAPSLFIGAMLGGAFGHFVHGLFPEITTSYGAYALVGMAALFSATGRATFTAIVILFEMTLDYSIILPLMFVCVTADQVSWALCKESIYSLKLKRKGLNFITDISVNLMSMTSVRSIMTTTVNSISSNMSTESFRKEFLPNGHSIYPVVNESNELLGVISKEYFEQEYNKNKDITLQDLITPAKSIVDINITVTEALSKVESKRDPRILVVDKKTNRLEGIISPIDFVRLNCSDADDTDQR